MLPPTGMLASEDRARDRVRFLMLNSIDLQQDKTTGHTEYIHHANIAQRPSYMAHRLPAAPLQSEQISERVHEGEGPSQTSQELVISMLRM